LEQDIITNISLSYTCTNQVTRADKIMLAEKDQVVVVSERIALHLRSISQSQTTLSWLKIILLWSRLV